MIYDPFRCCQAPTMAKILEGGDSQRLANADSWTRVRRRPIRFSPRQVNYACAYRDSA